MEEGKETKAWREDFQKHVDALVELMKRATDNEHINSDAVYQEATTAVNFISLYATSNFLEQIGFLDEAKVMARHCFEETMCCQDPECGAEHEGDEVI
jgi:hypothetical protein